MSASMFRLAAVAVPVVLATATLHASAAPAAAAEPIADDMPMVDYLGLLARIAPAAEQGARAYLSAVQERCGRSLQTTELRRALSDGDGDPVLMAMIRASQLRDTATLSQLGQRISCGPRSAP